MTMFSVLPLSFSPLECVQNSFVKYVPISNVVSAMLFVSLSGLEETWKNTLETNVVALLVQTQGLVYI